MQFGGEGLGIGSFEVGGAAMHSMMKKQSLSHLSGQVSGCDTHNSPRRELPNSSMCKKQTWLVQAFSAGRRCVV